VVDPVAFPAVPRHAGGLRITITRAHGEDDVRALLDAVAEVIALHEKPSVRRSAWARRRAHRDREGRDLRRGRDRRTRPLPASGRRGRWGARERSRGVGGGGERATTRAGAGTQLATRDVP
jgi:hypothetical protein